MKGFQNDTLKLHNLNNDWIYYTVCDWVKDILFTTEYLWSAAKLTCRITWPPYFGYTSRSLIFHMGNRIEHILYYPKYAVTWVSGSRPSSMRLAIRSCEMCPANEVICMSQVITKLLKTAPELKTYYHYSSLSQLYLRICSPLMRSALPCTRSRLAAPRRHSSSCRLLCTG